MGKCDIYFAVSTVTWVLAIIGWYVTNHHSNKREYRKEVRLNIDKVTDEIESLLKSSHTYYCSDNSTEQSVSCCQIYASFEKTSGFCQRLENDHSDIHIQKRLDFLFEEITGGDFGSVNLKRNSNLYMEKSQRIALLAENIRTEAENWYNHTFTK